MKKLMQHKAFLGISASVISILIGFAFGFLVLLASNPTNAVGGFITILIGGFSEGLKGTGNVLYFATPIILTGLSVVVGYALLGATWLVMKTEGELREEAYRLSWWLLFAMIAAMVSIGATPATATAAASRVDAARPTLLAPRAGLT